MNLEKANVLFSGKTNLRIQKGVKDILGLKEMTTDTIYLGNSLIFGQNKSKEFNRIKDKVQARLKEW